jgi:hypothetical protein
MVHAEGAARAHVCMFWRPALTIGPRHGFWWDIDVLCKIFGAYVLKLLHGQGHDCEGRVRMALGVAAAEAGKRTALVRYLRASHTRQEQGGNKQPPAAVSGRQREGVRPWKLERLVTPFEKKDYTGLLEQLRAYPSSCVGARVRLFRPVLSFQHSTSTAGKDYTGLLEASKTHFYGPRSGLIGVLAYI